MTKYTICILERENRIKVKTPVIELDEVKDLIYRSFFEDFFF